MGQWEEITVGASSKKIGSVHTYIYNHFDAERHVAPAKRTSSGALPLLVAWDMIGA